MPTRWRARSRRLGLALGLHEDDGADSRYQVAEVRQGVLAMLAGLARGGPVVLVFEDLHQADPLLLDLIEQLVKEARKVPLLVVCVARWEFLEDRPNWAGGLPDAVTLWVEQLSPEHALRLAMEAGGLDRADAERVAVHAGGNPLFIIEITGMLVRDERNRAAGRARADGSPAARDRAGGDRRAYRPAVPGRARARAARVGLSRAGGSTRTSCR